MLSVPSSCPRAVARPIRSSSSMESQDVDVVNRLSIESYARSVIILDTSECPERYSDGRRKRMLAPSEYSLSSRGPRDMSLNLRTTRVTAGRRRTSFLLTVASGLRLAGYCYLHVPASSPFLGSNTRSRGSLSSPRDDGTRRKEETEGRICPYVGFLV